MKNHPEKRFTWRQIDQVNWQPLADGLPPLPPEPPAADTGNHCPSGMALVSGKYLLDSRGRDDSDEVMLAQNAVCTRWRTEDHGVNGLCDRFDREGWVAKSASLPRREASVCVDRYEFPGEYGQFPVVVATFAEGESLCGSAGKRLCTESEWTFACEGEEGLPYPYGYERDTSACNIGVIAHAPDDDTLRPRTTARTAEGLDFAWQGRRSGESPRCVSPSGVFDLTGNVDEWTRSVRQGGYRMILKGGHWGPARQRCRPQTRGHGPHYVRYDLGFRCCKDPSP